MTTQTEAHELIRELEDEAQDNPDDYRWKAAAELRRLEADNAELLTALVDVSYTLEKARIWGGMDWTYNPLHPVHYLPARDKVREAIAKHGGAA